MRRSLWELTDASGRVARRYLWHFGATIALNQLLEGTVLGDRANTLYGRSVLIATANQFTAASILIELDGVATRVVICPPDLMPEYFASIAAGAGADTIISDVNTLRAAAPGLERIEPSVLEPRPGLPAPRDQATEWLLLTSGTSGVPKIVVHNLSTLTGAIAEGSGREDVPVWSTFYDIRRYGGLQILLRALIGGGSLVMSDVRESIQDFLKRAGAVGVTHVSGTPTHWRRALMSSAAQRIAPRYLRLSGEIADQTILDRLRAFYPDATIGHAFASTEAGVAFEVRDGLAGFPTSLIGNEGGAMELRVSDGSLRIRSTRTALRYSNGSNPLADEDGFVDTGDIVEQRGDRYYFIGRRGGIINVGGLKVHPEEVEAVINSHPKVQVSLVRARKNSITGFLLAADVLPWSQPEGPDASESLKNEIIAACRRDLAAYKVPVAIRFVSNLDVGASGKLVRSLA
ncbi:MAG: fatty acid--CoA ligase family protein [Stellaceae bacterium]